MTADLGNAIGRSQGYGHLYDHQILDGCPETPVQGIAGQARVVVTACTT